MGEDELFDLATGLATELAKETAEVRAKLGWTTYDPTEDILDNPDPEIGFMLSAYRFANTAIPDAVRQIAQKYLDTITDMDLRFRELILHELAYAA